MAWRGPRRPTDEERALIVAFIRKYDRHSKLADLIASGGFAIEDAAPVNALESSDLDPRIGIVFFPLLAEQQEPADRRDSPALDDSSPRAASVDPFGEGVVERARTTLKPL
jgi:hypothetical protein